ncbi:MAG TPA: PilT/PilU family type 4a pilus ATPase [Patescibacteria group bacterium]
MQALMQELLLIAVQNQSSDLHLMVGSPPIFRNNGRLEVYNQAGPMEQEKLMALIVSLMNENQKEVYIRDFEIDFSVSIPGKARFRANAYFQKGTPAISLRYIPDKIASIDELRLPSICHNITKLKQGFVLVTGPTGAGKSSTFAAIIDEINQTRSEHIVTIEDPMEFLHINKRSFISQRELETDTKDWAHALKSVLRQDPNIVYIGEMRDPETMAAAMTTAETGHLVFATLHTNSAAQTIERIVDSFPVSQQEQIVLQLSMVLEAVISQRLIPTKDGKRIVATEIMVVTPAVRNTIRENKTFQIDNIIQTSGNIGMRLIEQSLAELVNRGLVDRMVALEYSIRPSLLEKLLGNV